MVLGGNMALTPYTDTQLSSPHKFVRHFSENIDDSECVWHRDRQDRTVRVLSGSDWRFQHDNRVPFLLSVGDTVSIRAGEFHRLIKGTGQLVLEITEHTADK